jgi:hypothetical protein
MGAMGGLTRPTSVLKPVSSLAEKAVKANNVKSVKLKIKMAKAPKP